MRSALGAARWWRGMWPGGGEHGRPAAGGRGPDVAPAPPARPLPAGGQLAWAMTPRRRRWVHMTPSLLGEDQGVVERCLARNDSRR
jgi:hypothetical protein